MKPTDSLRIFFFLLCFAVMFTNHVAAAPEWVEPGWSNSIVHDNDNNLSLQGSHEVITGWSELDNSIVFSGYMEFDLRSVPSDSNLNFILHLVDTGGTAYSSTTIYFYRGDGIISVNDYSAANQGTLTTLSRPMAGGPTDINVTGIVRDYLANGWNYLGFKFIPNSGGDAFGYVDYWPRPEWRSGLQYDNAPDPDLIYDYESDGDVDTRDLAEFIQDFATGMVTDSDLEDFTAEYGHISL